MKFVFEDDYWWEVVDDDKIYTKQKGYRNLNKNLPITEASDIYSLDWSCLLHRNSPYGWIAPDGTWFGCRENQIDEVADKFLLQDETILELNGWVKVYFSLFSHTREWYRKGMIVNPKQAETLLEKGFNIHFSEIQEDEKNE